MSTSVDDAEVRKEDQENINEFGMMNNRLLEIRADVKQLKLDAEKMDDANTELMMNNTDDGKVMVMIGEAFVEVSESYATEYCENKNEKLASTIEGLMEEEKKILEQQEVLKKDLYARFGGSINLEA
jgi:prefoldin subunit 4